MFPKLIQALLNPQIYPEKTRSVELIQTHMSWVFIGDNYVYKVKKPVNLGYLDYTTLEKRLFFCRQEVELNRRLCTGIYLGVVPITQEKSTIALSGKGSIVEYAVKMRRLPQERMLDTLLLNNQVTADIAQRLAQKLADFHRSAPSYPSISAFGDIETIKTNTGENFAQTKKYIGIAISQKQHDVIKNYNSRFLEANTNLFQERVASGRIKDCHGDLHAGNVCIDNGICIYDCIEFNERFRYCDVASEIAFLGMDIDHYGRADLANIFIDTYLDLTGDKAINNLLKYYKCYRAFVRGKVACFKYDDPHIKEAEKSEALRIAQSYFDLAASYTRERPLLFITTGLVGTGKSTLARELAKRLGLAVISSDVTRKQLAGIPMTEHRFESANKGIYSREFSLLTYNTMYSKAKIFLSAGIPVILDATFLGAPERRKAKAVAEQKNADFFILECVTDENIVKQRLEHRRLHSSVSDAGWEIYELFKKKFKPVREVLPEKHIIVDTTDSLEKQAESVLGRVNL